MNGNIAKAYLNEDFTTDHHDIATAFQKELGRYTIEASETLTNNYENLDLPSSAKSRSCRLLNIMKDHSAISTFGRKIKRWGKTNHHN
ncbi:hypothetical protein ACTXT7_016064 [Hymenolepis weldensis]